MNNISISYTFDLLKKGNNTKVKEFVKNADLYLDDLFYSDNINLEFIPEEILLNMPIEKREYVINSLKLTSVYKGQPVPSAVFDSTGTQKLIALSSYIIEAIEEGKTLIIDELDSSLHFCLTKAIVAMFNNYLNNNAQLIFTTHDISLLDVKHLFRKEQIWFTHKTEDKNYLYSLATFTAKNGTRDTSDIINKYLQGLFGAIPNPELIEILINLTSKENK